MINKILLNYSTDYLVKKYSNLILVNRDRGTVRVLAQHDKLTEEVGVVVEPSEPPRTTDNFHSSSDSIMQLSSSESGS